MPSEGKKCPKCGSQLLKEERLHADSTATYLAHVCIKCFYRVRVCPKCGRIGQCCTCLNSEGCYHPQCSIFEAAESIADCVDEMLDAHHFSCAFHYKKGVWMTTPKCHGGPRQPPCQHLNKGRPCCGECTTTNARKYYKPRRSDWKWNTKTLSKNVKRS